jgi:GGDEF domain-containing protein
MHGLRWRSVAGPAAFALVAISLLVFAHFNRRVTEVVFWLTLGLVVALMARMIDTVRRQSGALEAQSRDALSDEVTGLRNRSGLEADIGAALAGGAWVLVLLELDGLQTYCDRFGYGAGDQLLRKVAWRLVEAVAPLGGTSYRIDASRLAVLVPTVEQRLGEIVLAASTALRSDAEGIGTSYGEAVMPEDAADVELAFQVAGQRLAANRQRQQWSARRQVHAVLIAALGARRPELRDGLRVGAYRALSLARRLGVSRVDIDDIALAAELQDIGLLAVPDAVLEKEAPLDPEEMTMVRRHPVEGERIIGAAPGLAAVAALVRSSAEHFDGSGHPDGLAGDAIPFGSRIIAVAVAFAAMTSPRPHRPAHSIEETMAELRASAGSQFDPRVVEALEQELAEESAPSATGVPGPVVG